jgi:hypothetical protein
MPFQIEILLNEGTNLSAFSEGNEEPELWKIVKKLIKDVEIEEAADLMAKKKEEKLKASLTHHEDTVIAMHTVSPAGGLLTKKARTSSSSSAATTTATTPFPTASPTHTATTANNSTNIDDITTTPTITKQTPAFIRRKTTADTVVIDEELSSTSLFTTNANVANDNACVSGKKRKREIEKDALLEIDLSDSINALIEIEDKKAKAMIELEKERSQQMNSALLQIGNCLTTLTELYKKREHDDDDNDKLLLKLLQMKLSWTISYPIFKHRWQSIKKFTSITAIH